MDTNKTSSKIDDFINFRKILHQFPEISGKEQETKKRILNFIKDFQPDETIEVGKTGIIFSFKGKKQGKSILIRAELDALPIQEINDFHYKSSHKGISHKCGHDGHMVILARLAFLISQKRPETGNVYLLFQPAEENGMGAKEVYADPQFQHLSIDSVIALHNLPGFPMHHIYVRNGAFTPAVSSIIVKFKGKTSHAAEPEKGVNPAGAISEFIKTSLEFSTPEVDRKDFFLVTPIYINMGEKSYGVSAGFGEVHLTIRAWDNKLLQEMSKKLELLAQEVTKKHGLETQIKWTQEFQANINDKEMVSLIRQAAENINLEVNELANPMKWGEDFGLFTEHFKGAMFGLGSGESQPSLHNPDYDFPDELIETGSAIFEEIIIKYLNEE